MIRTNPPRSHSHATRSRLRPAHTIPPTAECPFALAAWTSRQDTALRRMSVVSRIGLSAMGAGLAVSTYSLSTCLYHAELAGLPASGSSLADAAARAVAADVPARLLTGSPLQGGFGLLPLRAHVQARHAAMASRLLLHLLPAVHPTRTAPPRPALPGWLVGCLTALLTRVPEASWLFRMLPSLLQFRSARDMSVTPHPHTSPPWTTLAGILLRHACPSLHPAQTLLLATLASSADAAQGVLGLPALHQPYRFPPGIITFMAEALQALGPFPSASASRAVLTDSLADTADLAPRIRQLAWPQSAAHSAPPLPPVHPAAAPVAVRTYTALLTRNTVQARTALHQRYVRTATACSPRVVQATTRQFQQRLAATWRLPCDNRLKETVWRLAINCIPGSRVRPWTCPCSASVQQQHAGSQHSFWSCPVAVAVRDQLQACLGFSPSQASLWLLGPAPAGVPPPVWCLVCVAALDAMNYGRRHLWSRSVALAPDTPDLVTRVGNAAAARFWGNLADFVTAHASSPPAAWRALGQDHSFLCLRDGRLVLRQPDPAA